MPNCNTPVIPKTDSYGLYINDYSHFELQKMLFSTVLSSFDTSLHHAWQARHNLVQFTEDRVRRTGGNEFGGSFKVLIHFSIRFRCNNLFVERKLYRLNRLSCFIAAGHLIHLCIIVATRIEVKLLIGSCPGLFLGR
jgi:hypothetical protein